MTARTRWPLQLFIPLSQDDFKFILTTKQIQYPYGYFLMLIDIIESEYDSARTRYSNRKI